MWHGGPPLFSGRCEEGVHRMKCLRSGCFVFQMNKLRIAFGEDWGGIGVGTVLNIYGI